jgi:hypothetical protein
MVVAAPESVGIKEDLLLEVPVVLGEDDPPSTLTSDEVSGGDDEALWEKGVSFPPLGRTSIIVKEISSKHVRYIYRKEETQPPNIPHHGMG